MDSKIKTKHKEYFNFFLVILSLVITILSSSLIRRTLIETTILYSIGIGFFALFFILTFLKLFKKVGLTFKTAIFPLFRCISYSFGMIAVMAITNFYFAKEKNQIIKCEIINVSSYRTDTPNNNPFEKKSGEWYSIPEFSFKYNGKTEKLSFDTSYYKERGTFNWIILTIKQGLWGYDIVVNKNIIP
jgi:hypothetical protein